MNNSKGTSLMEIVIAIFIIACAFIPILRLVDFGSSSTSKINNYEKATRLAQDLIEECKHVPFKVYQQLYSELGNNEQYEINPEFYKDTQKSIEDFEKNSLDFLKDFNCDAYLKVKKNDLGQIIELWFEVDISWYDMGNTTDKNGQLRSVRAGSAYFNPDTI